MVNGTACEVRCKPKFNKIFEQSSQVLAGKEVTATFFFAECGARRGERNVAGDELQNGLPARTGWQRQTAFADGLHPLMWNLRLRPGTLSPNRGPKRGSSRLGTRPDIYRFSPAAWQTRRMGRIRTPTSSRPQVPLFPPISCHWPKAPNAGGVGAEPSRAAGHTRTEWHRRCVPGMPILDVAFQTEYFGVIALGPPADGRTTALQPRGTGLRRGARIPERIVFPFAFPPGGVYYPETGWA